MRSWFTHRKCVSDFLSGTKNWNQLRASAHRKSTSGGCYSLGSTMISWFSRKQSSVSLSTAEEKYIAAWSASCGAIWLRKIMSRLFNLELDTTMILCDNQSFIKMTENPMFHDRSKHIEIRCR